MPRYSLVIDENSLYSPPIIHDYGDDLEELKIRAQRIKEANQIFLENEVTLRIYTQPEGEEVYEL